MMNLNRTFGVEIEFIGDKDTVAQALNDAGIPCQAERYNHTTRSYWKIVPDSSIRPNADGIRRGWKGWELVSPVLRGRRGLEEIKELCAVLKTVGVSVNKTCGLHVHHDASDFQTETFKNIIKIYTRFEETIDSLVAPSRRGNNNTYCQSLLEINIERILKQDNFQSIRTHYGDRYKKLNIESFVTHGTIEFRQHQGTLNADKIINWIKLTQGIVERAVARPVKKCGPRTRKDWESFKYFLFLNPSSHNPSNRKSSYDEETKDMIAYYNKRRKELAGAA